MKVKLNVEKSPFCTIGPYSFTYGEPEHEVLVDELSEELKKQLLYNIRREVLKTDDKQAVRDLADVPVSIPGLVPANVIPIRPADVIESMEDTIDKNRKALKKILLSPIPSVKKEASVMRLGNLRRLMELEIEGKNRKKLISFFEKKLSAHTAEVTDAKGIEDMDPDDRVRVDQLSTQLTDVIVSEEKKLAIPEDVLNQIKLGA